MTRETRELDDLVSSAELAPWIGLSTGHINQLAREGVLPRVARRGGNAFPLQDSVRAYCDHARSASARRAADPELADEKKRLAREQADKIALQNARARGDLLDAQAVRAEWLSIAADLRARLRAVPARVAAAVGLDRPAAAALHLPDWIETTVRLPFDVSAKSGPMALTPVQRGSGGRPLY